MFVLWCLNADRYWMYYYPVLKGFFRNHSIREWNIALFIIQGCTCLLAHFVNNISYCISSLFSNYLLALTFDLLSCTIQFIIKDRNWNPVVFILLIYTDIIDWISSDNIIVECSVLISFVCKKSQVLHLWLRTLNLRVILIHVQLIDLLRSIYLTLSSR